ncbi:hypothetical protein AQEC111735_12000 [Aquirufa ecclesiirivi]
MLKVEEATVTLKRSDPDAEILPSVTATKALSALYNTKFAFATPLIKVRLVLVPKFTPATVGVVAGDKDVLAPEKVNDLEPV